VGSTDEGPVTIPFASTTALDFEAGHFAEQAGSLVAAAERVGFDFQAVVVIASLENT